MCVAFLHSLTMQNSIKELRIRAGMTQVELARRIGTTNQHLGRLENGTRQISGRWVIAISDALGVSADDILAAPSNKSVSRTLSGGKHKAPVGPLTPGQLGDALYEMVIAHRRPIITDDATLNELRQLCYDLAMGKMK